MRQNDPVLRQDAVSVILVEKGRVLLVRRANPPSHNLYAFPGGRVDPGEMLEGAALRELREETGLIARDPRPHRVYDLIERDAAGLITSHFLLTVFRAMLDSDSPSDPVAADDALEAGWFDPAAALELPMPESVRECLEELVAEV
jgi:ADP-ribose pyrophosphatase YjhB (NUDIX family)